MKDLVKMIRDFSDVMDERTNWKNPAPADAILFAIGEMGEAIQAYVYSKGLYSPNNVNETVQQEVVDCFIMCVKTGREIPEIASEYASFKTILDNLISANNYLATVGMDVVYDDGSNCMVSFCEAIHCLYATGSITEETVTARLWQIAEKQLAKLDTSHKYYAETIRQIGEVLVKFIERKLEKF